MGRFDCIKVLCTISVCDEVYSIPVYIIKFVIDLRQVSDFLRVFQFPLATNKIDHHDIIDTNYLKMSDVLYFQEPKGKYPKSVFFILGNEFCERFSYYGMRGL